jgi:hypothetical protein
VPLTPVRPRSHAHSSGATQGTPPNRDDSLDRPIAEHRPHKP